jgi:hypothetical protein
MTYISSQAQNLPKILCQTQDFHVISPSIKLDRYPLLQQDLDSIKLF